MCGHVGLAGDTTARNKKVFEEMLIADVVRGPHSTGIMVAPRTGKDVDVVKVAGPTFVLMGQKLYDKAMSQQSKCIIGHNRYATTGKITTWNAHPFEFKDICGAHNGTIDWAAIKKLHKNELYDTDSEAVFSHIQEHGLEATVDVMEGAWALVWYNKAKGTLNFYRNDKRDLYYAFSADYCTIFWASEAGMLKWIAGRNNVTLFDNNKVWQVTADTHYEWKIPDKITEKFEAPTRTKIEKKVKVWERPQHHTGGGGYGGADGTDYYYESYARRNNYYREASRPAVHSGTSALGTSNILPFTPNVNKQNPIPVDLMKWRPPYRDYNGRHMKKPEFTERTSGGCVMCQKIPQWGEYVHFCKPDEDGRKFFLCEADVQDEDVQELCKEYL